jgi:hypothetical protein
MSNENLAAEMPREREANPVAPKAQTDEQQKPKNSAGILCPGDMPSAAKSSTKKNFDIHASTGDAYLDFVLGKGKREDVDGKWRIKS